jgi:transposase
MDGLAALVREQLGADPLCGHLFVFRGMRANRVKILYWDRSGFCLWGKRLERGRFRFPDAAETCFEMEAAELSLILEGIELAGAKRRPRFVPGR